MTFGQSISNGFSNFVTFSGRASRSEFWWWTLFAFLANIALSVTTGAIGLPFIGGLVSLALLLPSLAVSVRRLHDLDRTGWWLLIMFTGIGIILLLVWDCIKGTTGPNRFGADPLG
jgi:uncharacterized membrane protein YhaH (DUF805 family)